MSLKTFSGFESRYKELCYKLSFVQSCEWRKAIASQLLEPPDSETMTTILLAVDTDVERAKKQAKTITSLPLQKEDTHISVLHVFRTDDDRADAKNLKSVKAALGDLEAAGFAVKVEQLSGDAVQSILEMSERIDADIISLAGRKRSPAGKALFGSVSQEVLLKSERPVLIETTD